MVGKIFIYRTPYGGVVRGVIQSVHGRTDLVSSVQYVVSENGNLYRVDEIEVFDTTHSTQIDFNGLKSSD